MTNKEIVLSILSDPNNSFIPFDSKDFFEILQEVDDLYTNNGESYITDEQYDKFRLWVEKKYPTHAYFIGVGSDVRGDKIKLPYKMGSLDQVQVGELKNWFKSKLDGYRDMVITDKMDGVSVLLVYDDEGKLQIALTRGNGYEGQDITRHVKLIPDVPKKVSGKMSVRAEIIFSESTFKKSQSKITRQDGTPFKNPRNSVAGLMNHKIVNETACKNLSVFAYELIRDDMIKMDKEYHLKFLTTQGFKVVHFEVVNSRVITDDFLKQTIRDRKNVLDYAIDGVVVDINSYKIRDSLKNDSLNPSYAFKYKILDADSVRNATVVGVEWNISKHGYAKPKIKLQPFDLQGVTISNTTGFNAKYIKDNNIGAGTIVKMTRSGDVIPYILEVVKSTKAELPSNVDDFEWSGNEVDLILRDKDTDEIKQKQLVSWATSMGIDGLKEATVETVFTAGYKTPADLVTLDKSLWVHLVGRNGGKIFSSIRKVLNPIDLSKLMGSYPSFGVGIGVRKIKLLLDSNPTLGVKILEGKLSHSDVINAGGYDAKTADKVMDGYDEFLKYLNVIDGLYSVVTASQKSGKLSGQKICFTGFRDKELEEKVESEGGEIASGVSKNTDLLVALDPYSQSGKVLKAEQLGVKIVSKEDFEKSFGKLDISKSVKIATDCNQFFSF